jgi:hypothetical protein
MNLSSKWVTFTVFAVCTLLASAQFALAQATASPSAYVYLINQLANNTTELDGYRADANGSLTRLSGSPFWKSNSLYGSLANTSHWLFASDGIYIDSFSIASNGALKKVSSINAQQHTGNTYTTVSYLTLDHTGSTLYAFVSDGAGDNAIQFFRKNSTTGALTYLGVTPNTAFAGVPHFLGNNVYAYDAGCIQLSRAWYAVRRSNGGALTPFSIDPPLPTNPNADYCPDGSAADPANNLAVGLLTYGQAPVQLAVYTADNLGNLTTKSTPGNMPTASVDLPYALLASPAGNLLAIAGIKGLQIFHFNGSNPITPYTGLIAAHTIYDLAWDTHNHLYAIGSGKVNAFRVTSTGYKQAPGSPYTINAVAITVLSK